MAVVRHTEPNRLLTKTGGFLEGYSHTLNPYAGCAFACSYCYVRRMPVGLFRGEPWGTWVDVKEADVGKFRRELRREKAKGPLTIFMSSATDPYQPAEFRAQATRRLLAEMADEPPDFLFVQTRSPLVTRDLDLLRQLGARVRVSVTVETDREDIRRAFTPAAPPIAARLRALAQLADAGVPCQATIAPALPSSERFAAALAGIVSRICIDDYFMGDGSSGRRTQQLGIRAEYDKLGLSDWYSPDAWRRVYAHLLEHFREDQIRISREGFLPGP